MGPRSPYICLMIVATLGMGAILGMIATVVLALNHVDAPQVLVATVSLCFGALSSFLVQPPKGSLGMPQGKDPGKDPDKG